MGHVNLWMFVGINWHSSFDPLRIWKLGCERERHMNLGVDEWWRGWMANIWRYIFKWCTISDFKMFVIPGIYSTCQWLILTWCQPGPKNTVSLIQVFNYTQTFVMTELKLKLAGFWQAGFLCVVSKRSSLWIFQTWSQSLKLTRWCQLFLLEPTLVTVH